jgi:hypothetical protein
MSITAIDGVGNRQKERMEETTSKIFPFRLSLHKHSIRQSITTLPLPTLYLQHLEPPYPNSSPLNTPKNILLVNNIIANHKLSIDSSGRLKKSRKIKNDKKVQKHVIKHIKLSVSLYTY